MQRSLIKKVTDKDNPCVGFNGSNGKILMHASQPSMYVRVNSYATELAGSRQVHLDMIASNSR